MAQETTMEKMEIVVKPIENIVENKNGEMFTTSLIIAEAFEKEHKDVLKAISNLECSEEFNQRNFAPMVYEAEIGSGAKREFPAYRLTRDGFAFLAMGFTGKKAAAWKEKFLDAFNAMEKALQEKILAGIKRLPAVPPREEQSVRNQRIVRMYRGLAALWAFLDKIPLEVALLSLCSHLKITDLSQYDESNPMTDSAFKYLYANCEHPARGENGPKASPESIQLLKYILDGCGQFRYSRDSDFEAYFESITTIHPDEVAKLTEHDANKMLTIAGFILYRALQRTEDMNDINELLEDEE